jgi:hypothetical protein
LNMLLVSDAAGKFGERTTSVENKRAKVEEAKTPTNKEKAQGVLERAVAKQKASQELANLGQINNPWSDPASGETNELRAKMKAAGFDADKRFKRPLETLLPTHILDVSETPMEVREGEIPSVRPTGFTTGAESMAPMGKLNSKAVAANFLPSTSRPSYKEAAQERLKARASKPTPEEAATPAGQEPSGSQPRLPSTVGALPTNTDSTRKGKFMPDTGKPEEGGTPGERLMREAEQAGLQPSLELMKGVLRGDQEAFEKLRAMIQSRTGQKPRFLPDTRPNYREAARARLVARAK